MVLNRKKGEILNAVFHNIEDFLNKGDLLVFNDARVIPARLFGQKDTGAKIELFLLEDLDNNCWEVLVKPAKRLKIGTEVKFSLGLTATIIKNLGEGLRWVEFNRNPLDIIERIGEIPLPPYISYDAKRKDYYKERYQTVYAARNGAVAAPTAGLHFSAELIDKIKVKGVRTTSGTLYVGLGTFKPMSSPDISDHYMHSERYELSKETVRLIKETKNSGKRVVAVGTTVVRLLEGVCNVNNKLEPGSGRLNIFIKPGYEFQVVDALITNFHLPKSTLLAMVFAFAGRDFVLQAYQKAIKEKYHFYSFGDAMFIQ